MGKSLPLISIIIPAYNVGKYIKKCITSAVQQTYSNIEVIVINDGSNDNTPETIDEIAKKDNRIKVIHKQNSGVSDTRNVGIKESKGDYLIFIDGDDYISCNYVDYMYSMIESTDAEMGISLECFTTPNEKDEKTLTTKIMSSEEATALLLSPRMYVGCWNKIFKKEVVIKNNIKFDTMLFYGEGLSFITSFAQLCEKVVVGNKKVYYYRRDNVSSATTQFNISKFVNGYQALEKIENNFIITKTPYIIGMMNFHKALFCKTAIMKIIENNGTERYKEEYELFTKRLRLFVPKVIFKSYVSMYYKIMLIATRISPKMLVFIDRKRR